MELIGLILATIVNIFWANSTLYWITTYAGGGDLRGAHRLLHAEADPDLPLGDLGRGRGAGGDHGRPRPLPRLHHLFLFLLRIFGRSR
jgi:uncharacterized protein